MKNKKLMNDDIVIYHIGGDDEENLDLGPIQRVIDSPDIRSNIQIVLFDGREGIGDTIAVDKVIKPGVRLRVVNACIFSGKAKMKFYVNKHPLSSSVFPPSQRMKKEHVMYSVCNTWGENTVLDFTMDIETNSLNNLITELDLPQPDILSMDIQGAELAALKGASKPLQNELLCVVNEIEFCEIYEDQGLFHHQHELLYNSGFRLVDIFSQQYWHPATAIGKGLLTVGESLYFRYFDLEKFCNNKNKLLSKLLKLSEISFAFQRFSFSNMIVEKIIENYPDKIKFIENDERYKPIFKMYQFVNDNSEKYNKDNNFFYKSGSIDIEKRFQPKILKQLIKNHLPGKIKTGLKNICKYLDISITWAN